MPRETPPSAGRDLRTLLEAGATSGLSDEQLLRRFVERRGEAEAAFEALVDRHGPMVWGVCRRALARVHEAEDAFQATFLVLARRAGAVKVEGSLGRWLHGVACRVAIRARADARKRHAREGNPATSDPANPSPDPERLERLEALDEELGRLPEKYRSPMILCHLEGLTYAVAAERLGCPPAAVKGRLARGRDLLRARLTRRGLALPLAPDLFPDPRPVVPPMLAKAAASSTAAGASSTAVLLAQGALRAMLTTRLIKLLALLAPASALVGLWVESSHPTPLPEAQGPPPRLPVVAPSPAPNAIVVPLPSKDDLRALLRQAAEQAIAIASQDPHPSSWGITTIAKAQALTGDLDGSKTTFAFAAREAGGNLGGLPSPWNLWRVGHFQAEAGFDDEARAILRRANEVCPGPSQEFDRDIQNLRGLANIARDQARLGDRGEARRTVDHLQAIAADLLAGSATVNVEECLASEVAGALAAVGDFEGTFRRAAVLVTTDSVVGKAALSAAKSLDRDQARRYVAEAGARIAAIPLVERRYSGLFDLAEAQARIGDFEGAKASARSIGEGPTQVNYDMTDGQPYAMLRIADVQRWAGHTEAARETIREAYRMIVDHPKMRFPEDRSLQVAQEQILLGDLDGALRSIGAIPEGQRGESLAAIARSQAIAGQPEKARETMDRALAEARAGVEASPRIPNPPPVLSANAGPSSGPDQSSKKLLAEIQAMAGDLAGAMETRGSIIGEDNRRLSLEQIVSARAAAGDVKGALDLATREPRNADERRLALEGVAQGVVDRLTLEPR